MELQLAKPLQIYKTMVLPVDWRITTTKVKFLDKLTARLTYGVQLFLEKIINENITRVKEAEKYRQDIQTITGLSSAYVQACRDKALWMFKSYRELHREWQWEITQLKKSIATCTQRITRKSTIKAKKRLRNLQHKLYRWKKREPSPPTVKEKVPIMFDYRVGDIAFSCTSKAFPLWARISTLKKGEKLHIPLHLYPYATKHLRDKEWRVKSFQIVKNHRLKRYEVHVVVEKAVMPVLKSLAGIDLGLKRLATAVSCELSGEGSVILFKKEDYKEFFIYMRQLSNRIAKLKRLGKYEVLKKLYSKRLNYARDFRRKLAIDIAEHLAGSLVVIGYPNKVRNCHYKGSGHRRNRKRVNHWAFKDCADRIAMAVQKHDGVPVVINEWWTTHRCSMCGSRRVEVKDRAFKCQKCEFTADRDVNAAFNILLDAVRYLTGLTKRKKSNRAKTKVFLCEGTGGAVDHPELSMSGFLLSLVETAQQSVRAEVPSERAE
ncbi:transposase [Candidatus Borrarchaeum sp.]|uniref:transposase n=1 Tax=Candidatus Borrarchaeum sp. TaxID=2846742 RepID=UPI00257A225E|nr:transposase [Candidatus Borrarchaeum sp.]